MGCISSMNYMQDCPIIEYFSHRTKFISNNRTFFFGRVIEHFLIVLNLYPITKHFVSVVGLVSLSRQFLHAYSTYYDKLNWYRFFFLVDISSIADDLFAY